MYSNATLKMVLIKYKKSLYFTTLILVFCGWLFLPSLYHCLYNLTFWPKTRVPEQQLHNITYDHRAIIINGRRELLLTGSIHYPRSTPKMWPKLMQLSKEAGINCIDTYVFWDLHEPIEGVYDFKTDTANLPLFLELAHKYGLYVTLRIGPYVCAEWNLGGLPAWLIAKPGMVIRTNNQLFMESMAIFVRKVVHVVQPYLASKGGPIILMQIENEYGNVEGSYDIQGREYIVWAADLANSLNTGVPWIMCQQSDIDTVILTCNGFYCDNWIESFWEKSYAKPPMFTELWTGWFQHWGKPKPLRPVEDLAFSVARWFAKGGSFVSYYMWHGGTNFGRKGSDWKTTSYDYDAPLDEFGFPSEPKYSHLKKLHHILAQYSQIILNVDPIVEISGVNQEIHYYKDLKTRNGLAFLSNYDADSSAKIAFQSQEFILPPWTVFLVSVKAEMAVRLLFSTSDVEPLTNGLLQSPYTSDLDVSISRERIQWIQEPKGLWDPSTIVEARNPLEQIRLTRDSSDYLWYTYKGPLPKFNGTHWTLSIRPATDVIYVYIGNYIVNSQPVVTFNIDSEQKGPEEAQNATQIIIPSSLLTKALAQSDVSLSILSNTMGLLNYGAHYDYVQKGLNQVKLNGNPMTGSTWIHQIGLQGERLRFYDVQTSQLWQMKSTRPTHQPLIWYKLSIPSIKMKSLLTKAGDSYAFALYLGSMGKGMAWVNGHFIGRYWDIGTSYGCKQCSWNGPFSGEKCLSKCGLPSQVYYHVPFDWISFKDDLIDIVLFEEKGGDPTGVKLVIVTSV